MQLHGIMRVMGLLCAILALTMFTSTAQASSTRSAVVATAANHCSQQAAIRHRNQPSRGLSSAQASKVQRMCQAAKPHIARINHWYSVKYRWTLYLSPHNRGMSCHQLKLKRRLRGPEALCYQARTQVRIHSSQLADLNARLAKLSVVTVAHNWLYQAFLCVHRGEGSWNDTRNPKYSGGLQMDKYFEAAYGAEFVIKYGGYIATDAAGHKYAVGGHAYLWTMDEQILAAERAYHSGRGFHPWPLTAHACGYI